MRKREEKRDVMKDEMDHFSEVYFINKNRK